ncbi:hypothetical protein CERZMDRAFT_89750 [Cercospora zeae-maydis SCOH1-5]|uniref:Uncharacterized protein n=1 Tax=Cercospora zeae-maydis SCOH1-5 TaxID=717836 RepID=A0A6A6FUD6_9PEZI|nr:hypothetical protein CERZMDRAFT_89750 [Cercospora zeae-maydis SCOH1-5]
MESEATDEKAHDKIVPRFAGARTEDAICDREVVVSSVDVPARFEACRWCWK